MAGAAGIVILVSIIAERARPFLAAMIVTLPITAGPSLLFLALDHDDAFMRVTFLSAMVANLASCAYISLYCTLAQRFSMPLALACAISAWIGTGTLLNPLPWTLPLAIGANIVTYLVTGLYVARFLAAPRPAVPPRSRWALPLRAIGVSLLVAAVTLTSAHVGPYFSAFLAVFPIVISSLVVILHMRLGGPAAAAVIASAVYGLAGFGASLASAAAVTPILGRYWALAMLLGVALAWNGLTLLIRQRKARSGSAP